MAPDGRSIKNEPGEDIVEQKKGKKEGKNTDQSSAPLANRIYNG
jgi:hypothetical protein